MPKHKKISEPDAASLRNSALGLLARREHSSRELTQKLRRSGATAELLSSVTDRLEENGLLSNARYAQQRLAGRIAQGYGPRYIDAELRMMGISAELLAEAYAEAQPDWLSLCHNAAQRKAGSAPLSTAERAKLWRQLAQRGFEMAHIASALGGLDVEIQEE